MLERVQAYLLGRGVASAWHPPPNIGFGLFWPVEHGQKIDALVELKGACEPCR